ncbi:hypothetical protein [Streptomyces afghaniensis]|uniref:hypothetical protein n=1 Tax=Streptomyces afghaniensis TaxID=66865 RepID=UPI0037A22834
MSDKIHIGDIIKIKGNYATGKVVNNGQSGSELQYLIGTAQALRDHVSPAERQEIDESLEEIDQGGPGTSNLIRLRQVATAAGEVGVPLLTAISLVAQMFGIG